MTTADSKTAIAMLRQASSTSCVCDDSLASQACHAGTVGEGSECAGRKVDTSAACARQYATEAQRSHRR
jgi:hypothetical protein